MAGTGSSGPPLKKLRQGTLKFVSAQKQTSSGTHIASTFMQNAC